MYLYIEWVCVRVRMHVFCFVLFFRGVMLWKGKHSDRESHLLGVLEQVS